MTEDLSRFAPEVKKFVQGWISKKPREEWVAAISVMADPLSVPCIVMAFWIGELADWPDDVREAVTSLTKFYKYTEIRNKPLGCPW